MDKNSLIGFGLLAVLIFFFIQTQQPSEAELAEARAKAQAEQVDDTQYPVQEAAVPMLSDTAKYLGGKDSVVLAAKALLLEQQYGQYASAARGENGTVTMQNELMKLTIAKKSGRIVKTELLNYHVYDTLPDGATRPPLELFNEKNSGFGLVFSTAQGKLIRTDSLYFQPSVSEVNAIGEEGLLRMVAASNSTNDKIVFEYRLKPNSYLLDYDVVFEGDDMAADRTKRVDIEWFIDGQQKEKNAKVEGDASTVHFKYLESGEVDEVSLRSFDTEILEEKTHWVDFKQQFFSSALIFSEGFEHTNSTVETYELFGTGQTKGFKADLICYAPRRGEARIAMQMYHGPNHYQTLKELGIGLEEVIDLGWFGFINEWLVIPIFNFLDSKNLGYGLIILILTLVIKMLLFPLTYKNFKSSAKMRVLKPQIDELNEKHKDGDAMKKQQATMALYKSVGVNPLAGCIPMLLQFPILVALFRFFPSSIELRQQSFLWADDLSSYDSILDLTQFGLDTEFYGDHVSLFTILMAISTFLYTRYNMQSQASTGPQASQMKIMMYFMPVMLLVWFNQYASGLSYYYLLANLISITQHLVIKKWVIDEDKLLASMQAHKAAKGSKVKKKSKFQQRLEEAQKQAQARSKK